MREFELYDGGYLAAPDEVVFAFNPCFLHLRDMSKQNVTIIITDASMGGDGQQVARITLQLYDRSADVDISAYLRSAFAGIGKRTDTFKASTNLQVSIGDVSFTLTVIYGAMLPGEVFNPSRTVRLWSAYPQIVPFFSFGGDTIFLQKDDAQGEEFINAGYLGNFEHYDNKSISTFSKEFDKTFTSVSAMTKDGQIAIRPSSEELKSTFSMQYDGSFTGIEGMTIINITIDDRPQCDDHIFLRWLDKWGFWQYWLCKIGSIEVSDAVVGSALTFLTGTTYPYYATRNIGKSTVKQVSACATNLTEEEWKMLSTIKGSINVCAFDTASQSWVPVNVATGASTWKMGSQAPYRQDYPLKVVFPTIQTQRL